MLHTTVPPECVARTGFNIGDEVEIRYGGDWYQGRIIVVWTNNDDWQNCNIDFGVDIGMPTLDTTNLDKFLFSDTGLWSGVDTPYRLRHTEVFDDKFDIDALHTILGGL